MKSIRAVLEELVKVACFDAMEMEFEAAELTVNSALKELSDIVLKEKKPMGLLNPDKDGILISENAAWNACCDHIVKMIRGGGE